MTRHERLQEICREYLKRLVPIASKFGLGIVVQDLVTKNVRKECVANEQEVELLSRAIDEERLSRNEIPSILGKSYRRCYEEGDFDNIKTLKRVGIYSMVSTLLHANNINNNKKKKIFRKWQKKRNTQ